MPRENTYINMITSKHDVVQLFIFTYPDMVKCLGSWTQGSSYGFICMGMLFLG